MPKFTPTDWDRVPAYLDHLARLNERFIASVNRAIALLARIDKGLQSREWQQALRGECVVWHSLQDELSTSLAPKPAEEVRTRLLRVYELMAQAASDAEAFLDDPRWSDPSADPHNDERLDAALSNIDVAVGHLNDVDRSIERLVRKVERKQAVPKRRKKSER